MARATNLRSAAAWGAIGALGLGGVAAAQPAAEAERVAQLAESDPQAAIARYRALVLREGVPWPATVQELETEIGLWGPVDRAVEAIPDGDRRADLRAEMASERSTRVRRFMGGATTEDDLNAGLAAARALGIDPATIEPRVRYNLELLELKREVGADGGRALSDQDARDAAASFVVWARQLPGGIGYLADSARLLEALESIARGGGDVEPVIVDPRTMGPGSTTRYRGEFAGDVLRFVPASGTGPSLDFVRVDPPSLPGSATAPEPFYIGTTEVSVGQFASIVGARPSARRALERVLVRFGPFDDPRRGPRTWDWGRREGDPLIVPARAWLTPWGGEQGSGPASETTEPPTAEHPMQHVSPQAAAYAAAAAGARLPSADEWAAATEVFGEPSPVPVGQGGRAAEVGVGGGEAVHHLRGNVGEYVTAPRPLDPAAALRPGTDVAETFFAANKDAFRVVGVEGGGGPAAERRVDLPLAFEGYPDVGFRLAFTAPDAGARPATVAERIGRLLSPPPFLRPR